MTWVDKLIIGFLLGLWCLAALVVVYWRLFECIIFPLARAIRSKLEARRKRAEYERVFKDSWRMPTPDECVKIVENDALACEALRFIGRNQIKEKEKEKMKNNKMPALELGDVVKYDDGPYGIVGNSYIYLLTETDGLIQITGVRRNKSAVKNIVKVYRTSGEGFPQGTLYRIYTGLAGGLVIWKKPEIREMTVDEISKELGYTVKVIGNK